jgi:hypothetical protein
MEAMAKATSCLHLPNGLFMQGSKQGSFHTRKYLQNQVAFPFMYPNNVTAITNVLALPVDIMLCIYLRCPHSKHPKNPFQSKQSKHFHRRSPFTECENGSNKVKLPKVGFNAIVPMGAGPNKCSLFKICSSICSRQVGKEDSRMQQMEFLPCSGPDSGCWSLNQSNIRSLLEGH